MIKFTQESIYPYVGYPNLFMEICLVSRRNGSRSKHTHNQIELIYLHYHTLSYLKSHCRKREKRRSQQKRRPRWAKQSVLSA
jgi:hypothetical protein